MADDPTDFNEDDFKEYNPHPYRGGYDIALTYGPPLPPSFATCYPISTPAASPPATAIPVIPTQGLPTAEQRRSSPPPPPSPSPPISSMFDYGLPENHQPEPFPWPDLFRSWPYSNHRDLERYGGGNGSGMTDFAEGNGSWNWRRGLDYLFGHAEGYGERRIGIDSYGIPIYASKKVADQSILVEIEPAPMHTLNVYSDNQDERLDLASYDTWSSGFYEETRDESHHDYGAALSAYNRHNSEKALTVEMNPNEIMQYERLNYHEVYPSKQAHYNDVTDNPYHSPAHLEGNSETKFIESFFSAYDQHCQEQTIFHQVQPIEPSWSQFFSYDGYQESSVSYQQVPSYQDKQFDEYNFFRGSSYEYEKHSYGMDDHVSFEPLRLTWHQNLGHKEVYEGEVPAISKKTESHEAFQEAVSSIFDWQSSMYADEGEKGGIFGDLNYACQLKHCQKPIYDQLEPYKPTWSQYASFYEDQYEPTIDSGLILIHS